MTQKTKLEIIGPYTPEHEGPFCTRYGRNVRIISKTGGSLKYPVVAIIDGCELAGSFESDGSVFACAGQKTDDLMNAREVPVAREFWIVNGLVFQNEKEARRIHTQVMPRSEIIHVREVLPGEK